LVPRWTVDGKQDGFQLRPDEPKLGRPKYESPRKQRNKIDTHPRCREQLKDPKIDLWITEGAGKIDALVSLGFCAIGFAGVWGWRGTNEAGGKTALACWESIALNERNIVIAYDDDAMTKDSVAEALRRLSRFLISKGAEIHQFDWVTFITSLGGHSDAI
jgi:hypothetical protein